MVQSGFVMLLVGLALMAFFTLMTLWYVPKVLAPSEHEQGEDDEHADGGTANF